MELINLLKSKKYNLNFPVIEATANIVQSACKSRNNKFGEYIYSTHILPVTMHSVRLSKILNANLEVCILASLLHDIASVMNYEYYPEHHIHGARIAETILSELNYEKNKRKLVTQCVYSHRASIDIEKSEKEELCVASADAMAHITEVPSLIYLATSKKELGIKEGALWVEGKLKRSWNKLCSEAKTLVKDEYMAALLVLNYNYTLE